MKKILLATLAACLFASTAAADIGPPGTVESTVTGVSVENALACEATDLGSEAKELFRTAAALLAKFEAGTLTPEEDLMGAMLFQSGACFYLNPELPGTVVLLDGHDYLVDYCVEGYECVRVIQKSDGIIEDQ